MISDDNAKRRISSALSALKLATVQCAAMVVAGLLGLQRKATLETISPFLLPSSQAAAAVLFTVGLAYTSRAKSQLGALREAEVPRGLTIWRRALFYSFLAASLVYIIGVSRHSPNEEVPAVLIMAVAAIVTAVEHWYHLRDIHKEFSANRSQQHEILGDIDRSVSSLQLELSAEAWRKRIHSTTQPGSYRLAKKRISAVVRFFDIDSEWFDPFPSSVDVHVRAATRLVQYSSPRHQETLWASWNYACQAAEIASFGSPGSDGRRTQTRLKLRIITEAPILPPDQHRVSGFHARSFIGLCWWLTLFRVLNSYYEHRTDEPRILNAGDPWPSDYDALPLVAQIATGICPIWVHVVDDYVWQIVSDGSAEDGILATKIRSLTVPYERRGVPPVVAPDELAQSYAALVDADYWAGGRAQFYARSFLRATIERGLAQNALVPSKTLLDSATRSSILTMLGLRWSTDTERQALEDVLLLFMLTTGLDGKELIKLEVDDISGRLLTLGGWNLSALVEALAPV